ncbi:PSD1 and planctomycete cytochrome C domain-containing protein [Limnoglobus roseus]|uniref:Cytochrome c domain-containing protein n=1 Tax=Limnoglobus roseus TaxID=2598579 RepID=A0A5C1ALT4_9BACT|nr:PSD1 and planctomycete cytochrome C domain-containing protein [Limnoglobus roseus]QEL19113.1 hypothetical protein PX52LOC_06170 [Limnoglobus roseus]
MRSRLLRSAVFAAVVLALPSFAADEPPKKNPFRRPAEKAKAAPVERPAQGFTDAPTAEQVKFFEAKIRPVLVEQCYKCHSSETEKVKAGLTLDTRDGLRRGGDTGPAIVPGNATKSLLIDVLTTKDEDRQMPPKKKLPDTVIADFKAWVTMGAPDPRDGAAKVVKNEIDIEKGRQFWAFQPLRKAGGRNQEPGVSQVDSYLQAGWAAKGLKPVPAADKVTLVRRMYLDLIGLPPTLEQVDAFVADQSPDAVSKLAEELLASAHFGERWGRHWLDVARYGESTGKAVNFNYPHAWRYRDYVIAAYNADKPFDQFVKEQLAGDLLLAKTDREKAEHVVATGFLALGTKNLNERNRLQFELDLVDEQIDAFSQAFLGLTAACARCHDHKFDPIPTKDYYALAGIFRSTETCYGTVRFAQANQPSSLISLPQGSSRSAIPEKLTAAERTRIEESIRDIQKKMQTSEPLQNIFNAAQLAIQRSRLSLYEDDGTPKLLAMGVREKFRPADSAVFNRGEVDKPGATVSRGVLQVVTTKQPKITRGSGRLELANWVASAENPLTARVYVNRVWLHLFGRGLVATPDNFGTTGQPPSNPALLDHLATWFIENGWSTKKLVKYLVTTRAYQLSTTFDAKNHEADPDNALAWRMTPGRLDAEVIHDAMLAVSGRLDRKAPVGSSVAAAGEGPSQRPRLGSAVASDPNDPHRAVYLPSVRDNLQESLALFDAADPNLIVGDRTNTTVPAQALFLLNNPFVIRQADATAAKLIDASSSDSERIRQAYRLIYGRTPSAKEQTNAESFVKKYSNKHSRRETWTAFSQALFGSAEFLMRN